MSASAFCDRGLIEHLNGIGWLVYDWSDLSSEAPQMSYTCLMVPLVNVNSGSITLSFESTAFVILKTDKVIAMVMNNDASAKNLPGQILIYPALKICLPKAASKQLTVCQIQTQSLEGLVQVHDLRSADVFRDQIS